MAGTLKKDYYYYYYYYYEPNLILTWLFIKKHIPCPTNKEVSYTKFMSNLTIILKNKLLLLLLTKFNFNLFIKKNTCYLFS